jgi:hypothetical protein
LILRLVIMMIDDTDVDLQARSRPATAGGPGIAPMTASPLSS